jgi:hypothetical protein
MQMVNSTLGLLVFPVAKGNKSFNSFRSTKLSSQPDFGAVKIPGFPPLPSLTVSMFGNCADLRRFFIRLRNAISHRRLAFSDESHATGKPEYLERGFSALRSQFPISPSENWAHGGYGRIAGVSSFHSGTGSGTAGIELEEDFLHDAVVDVASPRTRFAVSPCAGSREPLPAKAARAVPRTEAGPMIPLGS